jgi:endonuclease/exonuclease/phosphatase family metal-dependent hydrolase
MSLFPSLLPSALLLSLWLLFDFTGILLSVISTYFYFGWAGMPLLVVRIFLIALFAFSGPLAYRLLLFRLPQEPVLKTLLGLQAGLYLLISLNRQSDLFAWGAVAGVWVSGLALMAVFRHLAAFRSGSTPFFMSAMAVFLYLGVRVSNQGLALFFAPPQQQSGGYMAWILLLVGVFANFILPLPALARVSSTPATSAMPSILLQLFGSVLGPLIGLSVGLIYNLHIWSAKTPEYQAAVYFLSLSLGLGLAWGLFRRLGPKPLVLLPLAGFSLALSLFAILYQHYSLPLALLAHGAGCLGLSLFWLYFFSRFQAFQRTENDYFPVWGLQLGFVLLLVVLAIFLLNANPNGFWLVLLISLGLLLWAELWAEMRSLPLQPEAVPLQRFWLFALGCFMLPGLMAFAITDRSPDRPVKDGQWLRIMSTNIRYGWTDNYRFDPFPHLQWLKHHPVDLLGIQEVNKGHTSGAYSDLYRLYQQALPGHWRYADANYGFGNALMTSLPILSSETRLYQAKDILRRSCLKATVQVGSKPVDVYITHLSHLPHPNLVRQAQMQELLGWIRQSKNPWLVIGDFNAFPDSPEVQSLLKLAHPAFQTQPELLKQPSFPSLKANERIDYVFFSPQFKLRRQQVLETAGSTDHRPILTELALP